MINEVIYHDIGENFFQNGNSIYINYHSESSEPHLHIHEFIEISFVASGSGVHIIGDKKYEVCKGDLFLINYHIPHEFRSYSSSSTPLKVYNCVFKPDFINMNLIDFKNFTDVIHYLSLRSIFSFDTVQMNDLKILGGENSEIELIYQKMLQEYTKQEDGYIELLRVYLIELLVKIFRSIKASCHNVNSTVSQHAILIEKSIQYLKENYSVSAKLTDLASQAFLSPTYFCRLFKDYTGMTLSEYVQQIRVEQACNLLQHTNHKIITIAQMIGYKDIKHFNEVFKKITGKTPSDFKKIHDIQYHSIKIHDKSI